MMVHHKVNPYMRVQSHAKKHTMLKLTKAWTQTVQSEVHHADHEATMCPTNETRKNIWTAQ